MKSTKDKHRNQISWELVKNPVSYNSLNFLAVSGQNLYILKCREKEDIFIKTSKCHNFLVCACIVYCLPVYGRGKGAKKLDIYIKGGIRICANLRYNSHTNDHFKHFRILKYDDMYTLQLLLLGYKFATKSLPINSL